MDRQRVLITVKTYPTLSRKYGETVCTAGVKEDGSWLRIYPVPFRRLGEDERYRKFDWLECRLERNRSDPRPESFRPLDVAELQPVGHIGTDDNWHERRRLLLRTARVHDRMDDLIADAKANRASLAVFKPKRVIDLTWEEEEREWNPDRLRQIREATKQHELFEDNAWRETFRVITKLPYSFTYTFEDVAGRRSSLQVLDWEIGMLYWNCLKNLSGRQDEPKALNKVRQKYFDDFCQKDLHLFLGTTQQFHFVAPNPWVVIGVLPIPYDRQPDLF